MKDEAPAFPNGLVIQGMTLRDYFAAQILNRRDFNDDYMSRDEWVAICYQYADAMMKERIK